MPLTPHATRRAPLLATVLQLPFTYLSSLAESVLLIDYDAYARLVALPLGLACKLAYYLSVLSCASSSSRSDFFASNAVYGHARQRLHMGSSSLSTVSRCLAVVACLNVVYLLMRIRTYTFLPSDHHWSSTRMSRQEWHEADTLYDNDEMDWSAGAILKSVWWSLWGGVFPQPHQQSSASYVYTLNVWSPPLCCVMFAVAFLPLDVVFWWGVAPRDYASMAVLLSVSVALYLVVGRYTGLVADRELVHRGTFEEYGRKYVTPRLNIARKEAGVDASEAWDVPRSPTRGLGLSNPTTPRLKYRGGYDRVSPRAPSPPFRRGSHSPERDVSDRFDLRFDLRYDLRFDPRYSGGVSPGRDHYSDRLLSRHSSRSPSRDSSRSRIPTRSPFR